MIIINEYNFNERCTTSDRCWSCGFGRTTPERGAYSRALCLRRAAAHGVRVLITLAEINTTCRVHCLSTNEHDKSCNVIRLLLVSRNGELMSRELVALRSHRLDYRFG